MTLPDAREAALVAAVDTRLRLGGEPMAAAQRFMVEDPSSGEVVAEVHDAGPADGARALEVACARQPDWAATAPRDRAEVLRCAWELMIERRDDLALLMTIEMGKPLADSLAEVTYAAEFLRWFSEEAVRIDGGYLRNPSGPGRILVTRAPVGPCLLITPWNFPLAMGTRKLGPALAAGCTAIVKPAQLTPLSMLALSDLLVEAGLPDGVVSVLPTSDAGGLTAPLLEDPRLRKLSFTGSTAVGRSLLAAAAPNVLRTSMELGGNAPLIVFDDADLDVAVQGALTAKMRNLGEACTAANRILVQRSIAEAFSAALTERMGALRMGRGTDEGVQVGPLVDRATRDKVADLVGDAVDRGATVRIGGRVADRPGWFHEPTVLTDVDPGARLHSEEIFGPVAAIVTFDGDDDAVARANDTEYGLAGYLFTRDLDRALRTAERLEVGMVGVNQGIVSTVAGPFGGVKASGVGREGGFVGIDEYLEPKLVFLSGPD